MTSEYKYSYSSYYGDSGKCTYDDVKPTAEVELDGYVKLPANDYNSLLHAVATEGPIVVSVDAS
jgi:cathepsin L